MTASEKSILHALENSMFMFPEVPGHWDLPTFPGLRAHATPEVSHLFGNMVGVSTLTQENVDSVIAQVQEFFAKRGHMVGWWLNPSSTPLDLVSRLETAGFSRVIEQAGLVLTDMQRDMRCNPLVTVRKASIADRENLIRLYTVAYPIPENWPLFIATCCGALNPQITISRFWKVSRSRCRSPACSRLQTAPSR